MKKRLKAYLLIHIILLISFSIFAQSPSIKGIVNDENGTPLIGASIILPHYNNGTVTNNSGYYQLEVPVSDKLIIKCSYLGYSPVSDTFKIEKGSSIELNFTLSQSSNELSGVTIIAVQERDNTLTRINMKSIDQLPNSSGNIESIIKTMSGVVSGNELSSQYSVRGGNFDENLIYVNDIEIYRPLLVQSATQEGLSFVNPNMVSSIQFSAGGFEAEYGDKMSSVLNINYKKPTEFEGTVIGSLLGTSLHLAGVDKSNKLSFNTGFRYKTTNYLLNSLDLKGEYLPRFADLQALINYDITPKSSISILGNYSTNRFTMIPETRSTDFGTIQQTINFTVFYEGQERDRFDSYMGAISYSYTPNTNLNLKFIGSIFDTDEEITYDIRSDYWISQVSTDTTIDIGTGGRLEHARNRLKGNIYALEHKGLYKYNNSSLKWGLKIQNEYINDVLKEWNYLDSAGMSTPFSDEEIILDYSYRAYNVLNSFRYQAFIQNSSKFYTTNAELGLNIGLRFNYWDYNNELLISPRAIFSVHPYWDRNIDFFLSAGVYGQPPYYKELKNYKGDLFPNQKAQKSYHFVLGSDVHYQTWGRPFIFTTEIYYKYLTNLTPYKVDQVQVKYMPEFVAKGYAAGVDFRVNGEFVPGVESWFSLSLLKTREDTYNDSYVNSDKEVIYPGYYRRPSDQTLTLSVFFQDYLPSNPDYKVHLLINYGTGLPYSGPNTDRPSETFMLNQYRRVDMGFSRIIKRQKHKKIGLHDIWLSVEILNILDAPNMASYDWIKTVENNEGYQSYYAIPNYLTGRRFNFKISTKL